MSSPRKSIRHLLIGRVAPTTNAVKNKKWTCYALGRSVGSSQDEGLRPILPGRQGGRDRRREMDSARSARATLREPSFQRPPPRCATDVAHAPRQDRKSTRLNSSHL